jgi:hypothetical protein
MAKKPHLPKLRMGRPVKVNPLTAVIRARVEPVVLDALERYREENVLTDHSDAVRHLVVKGLRAAGLL